jgi:hypothetical protein
MKADTNTIRTTPPVFPADFWLAASKPSTALLPTTPPDEWHRRTTSLPCSRRGSSAPRTAATSSARPGRGVEVPPMVGSDTCTDS